jgi:hypothetical protein
MTWTKLAALNHRIGKRSSRSEYLEIILYFPSGKKIPGVKTGEEGMMGTVVHTSRIAIVREKGPTRIARIEGFPEPVYYGVHGGIKNFYKVDPEKEHAATLDHIVGAVSA